VTGDDGKAVKLSAANATTNTVSATIDGGSIIAPMIIINGTLSQLQDSDRRNDPKVYVPFMAMNPNKVDHIRLLGDNVFGFEDLGIGGDFDYNDMVIKMDFQAL
jgi:hypothetical protein